MTGNFLQFEQIFANLEVPSGPEYNHGFLEIIGKETHENIWSKLYAHFLEDLFHNDSYPFLEALYRLIKIKGGPNFRFGDHQVETEVTTMKGRIDLVIMDKDPGRFIIIENKVYHHLNNDLLDYWNHYQVPDDRKVGIILALSEKPIPSDLKGKFICITHIEWLSEVEKIYSVNGPFSKPDVYLQDFIKTVKQITQNRVMNEQSTFYFRHAEAVNMAVETRHAAEQYIIGQYSIIADKLGLTLYGNELAWRNFWDESHKHDIYFTLVVEDLFSRDNTIEIIIELYREPLKNKEYLIEAIKNHPQYLHNEMKKDRVPMNGYFHLCYRKYKITENDLPNFADFVVKKIQADFGELFIQLIKSFKDYSKVENYPWEKNLNP